MSLLAALCSASHLLAPLPPPEPRAGWAARSAASTGLVCLAAGLRLPMDEAMWWLGPLRPLPVGGSHHCYLTFDGTPLVLVYDRAEGACLGVAPPDLLWPLVARPRLFAGLQGDWRAAGVRVTWFDGGLHVVPIGYETVYVRGNLLCYGAVGAPPAPEFSFLVTAERRRGADVVASSYPCRDDRDALAAWPSLLHFRRAVVPVGPALLTAGSQYGGVEVSVWYRPAR